LLLIPRGMGAVAQVWASVQVQQRLARDAHVLGFGYVGGHGDPDEAGPTEGHLLVLAAVDVVELHQGW
jgi:hypothetical protein